MGRLADSSDDAMLGTRTDCLRFQQRARQRVEGLLYYTTAIMRLIPYDSFSGGIVRRS